MAITEKIKGFRLFKPVLRIVVIALAAYIVFSYIVIPLKIRGNSMEPTYRDGGFNFCLRLRYLFSEPSRHDVVTVEFAGRRVMLLKRVVGLEGETVSFKDGVLHVNGKPVDEPYVKLPCKWNLPPRTVEKDHLYLVGDNRMVPMYTHDFGQTHQRRIIGAPLW